MPTRSHRVGNAGSALPRRRRAIDPMQSYDALPPELRRWLANACLPWSPHSARCIWVAAGGATNPQSALARLEAAERATLARERTGLGAQAP